MNNIYLTTKFTHNSSQFIFVKPLLPFANFQCSQCSNIFIYNHNTAIRALKMSEMFHTTCRSWVAPTKAMRANTMR